MTAKLCIAACVCAIGAAAQPFSAPLIGITRDPENRIHPVLGVAGSFHVGDFGAALKGPVLDYSFSGRSGFVKTKNRLIFLDARAAAARTISAPRGAALTAFRPDGSPALYYFPAAKKLWRVDADGDIGVSLNITGVLDIAFLTNQQARLLIQRDDGLWSSTIDLKSGEDLRSLRLFSSDDLRPGALALVLPEGLLLADDRQIFIRHDDGSETKLSLPQPARTLRRIGEEWIEVAVDAGPPFALRLHAGKAVLFRLPMSGRSR